MWFPFPPGGITCERVAQVTPPQPAWRGALGVCVWEIWALPPYLHREGPHCNSSHHLSSTDICTGIAQIFPGVFFQICSPLFNIRILLEYQHMCCTNLTQMVHGGGVHCSCNRHHTGRGRVSITLIRLAQILYLPLHRYCICPTNIIYTVYTVYIVHQWILGPGNLTPKVCRVFSTRDTIYI